MKHAHTLTLYERMLTRLKQFTAAGPIFVLPIIKYWMKETLMAEEPTHNPAVLQSSDADINPAQSEKNAFHIIQS